MPTILQFDRVAAGYRGHPVLRDLSLRLRAGEMVALLGPNGAGKSTLLQVATGLLAPTEGTVRLLGMNPARMPAARRAALAGVVLQELAAPATFTVGEMVLMGRTAAIDRWYGVSDEDRAAALQAMVYTDTIDLRTRRFMSLSGGERQRVTLAMALARRPRLLLLDEPTAHLDMSHRMEVLQLICRIHEEQGVTVLTIAHDLNLAAEFFPRLMLLDQGRLVADGTPAEVLSEKRLRKVYRCSVSVRHDALSGSPRVFPRPDHAAQDTGPCRRIHLICGGGSGEALLRRLVLAGHEVSCGVINARDTGAVCAQALDVAVTLERPFAPIAPATLEQAATQVLSAEIVIVCDVPFGPGNVANLELATRALAAKRPVLLNTADLTSRDFTPDRVALPRLRRLLAQGAHPWEQLGDLFRLLEDLKR